MGNAARRRATYEDVLAAPEHVVAEVVDGVLRTQPRPAARHARAASSLGGELAGPFDRGRGGPGGWVLLDEPELHLGADILVPDLAGWRRERMPVFPYDAAFFTLAPDWICEVLSPSTAKLDRGAKLTIYARESVRHAWLVDPIDKTLEVLRIESGRWSRVAFFEDTAVVRAEPFDAIELELGSLWP
ncbi:MAG: Uma2 family endonuclease [Myxococcales bacterium]|nr:Uma2 family endonuclease [Myxococcales bacterium]